MGITAEVVAPRFTALAALDAARNAQTPNGKVGRALAEAVNFLLGRAPKTIPGKSVTVPLVRNTTAELPLWRTRYRASPNGTTLVVEVTILPTDNANVATPTWYVKVDGVSSALRTHNVRCDAGSGRNLRDGFPDRLEVPVAASAKHTVELYTKNCRLQSWGLHEKQRPSLVVGTDTVVDWARLAAGLGIGYQDLDALVDDLETVRQKMAGACWSWNVDDPATPVIPAAGAGFANLVDASDTVSLTIPTQYRGTFGDVLLAAPTGIPMYMWCFAERTAGAGSGHYKLNGSGGGTATVNIAGALGIYSGTTFVTFDQAGDDLVKPYASADAATTIKIYAAGCFPLIGT